MAGSLNRVQLIGHVGKDPEIRSTQGGAKIANLTLATSETWNDKASGEKKERTEWHRISIFNDGLVGVVERFVKKGSKLFIEGQLTTRKWTDQAGVEKYSTEINLGKFNGTLILLDGKQSGGEPAGRPGGYPPEGGAEPRRPAPSWEAPRGGDRDINDEIPF